MWEEPKYDVGKEERKVTNNLSKLIQDLQKFPSKRSRLNTESLWNLIDELESLKLENNSKSVKNIPYNTYSKRLLNVNTSSEKMKINCEQRYCTTSNQKFRNGKPECKQCKTIPCPDRNSNQFQEKDFIKTKTTNTYICLSCKSKGDCSKKVEIITKSKEVKTNRQGLKNNLDGKVGSNRLNNLTKQNEKQGTSAMQNKKNSLNNSIKKSDENKTLSKKGRENIVNSKEKQYCNKCSTKNKILAGRNDTKINKQNKNKIINLKCKSHQCTPNPNTDLQKIILDKDSIALDRCSVVRKLTNYWNNLLNNDSGECSTGGILDKSGEKQGNILNVDHVAYRVCDINKNIRAIAKSRHLSESNINIMKRVDDLDSQRLFGAVQSSIHQPTKLLTSKPDSIEIGKEDTDDTNTNIWENKVQGCIKEIDNLLQLYEPEIKCELKNILDTLTSYYNHNELSDNSTLFQSVFKKLLFIMVSILKSQSNLHLQNLEMYIDEVVKVILQTTDNVDTKNCKVSTKIGSKQTKGTFDGHTLSTISNNKNMEIDHISENELESVKIVNDHTIAKSLEFIRHKNDECTDDCQLPEKYNAFTPITPRIGLTQVQNALRFYLICREMLWSAYNYRNSFTNCHNPQFNYFCYGQTEDYFFIYEEEIVFEGESMNDDDSQFDAESGCGENNIGLLRSSVVLIGKLFEHFNLNSFNIIVGMICKALLYILIWRLFIKEIFS